MSLTIAWTPSCRAGRCRLAPTAHLAGGVAAGAVLFTSEARRYGAFVLPLGFRFDVDAVLVGGVAHRRDCYLLERPLPDDAVSVSADGVHRAAWCPRECPRCHPPFETMLGYQLERSIKALVPVI